MGAPEGERTCYRLPPCPACDVEGMERWLSDLALEGLFLTRDGFFAGVATFERGEPLPARYRLEAAQKEPSFWNDYDSPDPEQVALGAAYAWEYVARRGSFYIYRTFEPAARELNTDPEVQALALDAVKKRQWWTIIYLLWWLVVYPLLMVRGGLVLTVISMGSWVFLLGAALFLGVLADAGAALAYLRGLQKRLRNGGKLDGGGDWRRRAACYHGKNAAQLLLAVALVGILLHGWSVSVMDEDRTALEDYAGVLPFAAMADFAGGEAVSYRATMTGLSLGFNSVKEWSDPLASRCIKYAEHAEIGLADGGTLDGGLYVDYYEAAAPAIAKAVARELYRTDRWRNKNFEPMDTPALRADWAVAYRNGLHWPTVVARKGNVVIRACFFQTSPTFMVAFEDWARTIIDST